MKRSTLIGLSASLIAIIILCIAIIIGVSQNNTNTQSKEGVFSLFDFFSNNEEGIGGFLDTFVNGDEEGSSNNSSSQQEHADSALLRQIFPEPVSGTTFITYARINEETGYTIDVPAVRVIERATGNVFDIPLDTFEPVRITNTTIPGIYDSFWNNDGTITFTRSAYNLFIKGTGVEIMPGDGSTESIGSAQATYSYESILDTDTNPSQDMLYILEKEESGSRGIITSFDGTDTREVFTSPLSEWLVDWAEDEYVYLTTKPSGTVPGYLYYTSIQDGALHQLLSNRNGLTTKVNNRGDAILFSESSDATLYLSVLSEGEETLLPFDTLPEKCVWDANGTGLYCGVPFSLPRVTYPDDWYKGNISFNDALWYVDIETFNATFLISPEKYNAKIDIIQPILSPDEHYLLFLNKKDMTPWLLNITDTMAGLDI